MSRKRGTVGILGKRKDPNNTVLFSFIPAAGDECPSDDEEDTDYSPYREPKEICTGEKTKSIKLQRSSSGWCIKPPDTNHHLKNEDSYIDNWGKVLPVEILHKIFTHAIQKEGSIPFLIRASKVNNLWNSVASNPSLWIRVDLSYGWIKSTTATLKWLVKNRLQKVQHLDLTSWKHIGQEEIKVILECCPSLRYLSVAYCTKVHAQEVKMLADSAKCLTGIDLSSSSADAVTCQTLKYFLEKRGKCLKHLSLSGNMLKGFNNVLNTIADTCEMLEVLEVSNCEFSSGHMTFNIEKLQHGCPKLKVLRLANSEVRAPSVSVRERMESPGFPNLEEVSLAVDFDPKMNNGMGLDSDFIERLFKCSDKLRLLDLRGSKLVKSDTLHHLPFTNIQHFFFSHCSPFKSDSIAIVMQKWQHSLIEVDLSWNVFNEDVLELAINKLADDSSTSQLESLDLSGTPVPLAAIKTALEGCPKLNNLNLTSCRLLPRGVKRHYMDSILSQLRKDIDRLIQQDNI